MAKFQIEKWTPLLTLLVGTLIGPGFFWQWRQSGRDVKKQELDAIVKTTDLRKQENDLYSKIIDLTNEYLLTQEKYTKTPSNELRLRLLQQNSQLEFLKDDFTALDVKLAHLENRPPRTIRVAFKPPEPPRSLGATVQ